MKVILLRDVRRVGSNGEVKEVADGFARNYLFPHKFACPATEEKIKEMEAQSAQRTAALQKETEALDGKVTTLRGKVVSLSVRATEKGGLFKAVGPADIAKAIRSEHSLEIPESAIHINEPIKTLGEHVVSLKSASQSTELGVRVTAGQ